MTSFAKMLAKAAPAVGHYSKHHNWGIDNRPLGAFPLGNQYSTAENLTEEANSQRRAGMIKSLQHRACLKRGDKFMTIKAKKRRAANKRVRLKETIALEARQVQEIARKSAKVVMKMLQDIVEAPNERASDRIAAGNSLLDRAYGKANQTNTNLNVDANGKATDVSRKELTTRIEETLRRVEELTGGAPKEKPRQERPADIRERDGNSGSSSLH